jgi:DNA-directed RNA polymerase beta subunit
MTIGQLLDLLWVKRVPGSVFENAPHLRIKGLNTECLEVVETGFHSSGNEIPYNGMDGTQVEMEIFVGPILYEVEAHG